MKRNMDLVRKILLEFSDREHGYVPERFSLEGFSDEEVGYHCYLLNDAGLIVAADTTSRGDKTPTAMPIKLTWKGHEFIDNAKNESIWAQTKEVTNKIGDVSFSVWTSVLSKIVMKNLGIES